MCVSIFVFKNIFAVSGENVLNNCIRVITCHFSSLIKLQIFWKSFWSLTIITIVDFSSDLDPEMFSFFCLFVRVNPYEMRIWSWSIQSKQLIHYCVYVCVRLSAGNGLFHGSFKPIKSINEKAVIWLKMLPHLWNLMEIVGNYLYFRPSSRT